MHRDHSVVRMELHPHLDVLGNHKHKRPISDHHGDVVVSVPGPVSHLKYSHLSKNLSVLEDNSDIIVVFQHSEYVLRHFILVLVSHSLQTIAVPTAALP